jgi:hypothetical protein
MAEAYTFLDHAVLWIYKQFNLDVTELRVADCRQWVSEVTMNEMCRYQVACWLSPRAVPVQYSSTVFIQLGSTKKRYLEEITFQVRESPSVTFTLMDGRRRRMNSILSLFSLFYKKRQRSNAGLYQPHLSEMWGSHGGENIVLLGFVASRYQRFGGTYCVYLLGLSEFPSNVLKIWSVPEVFHTLRSHVSRKYLRNNCIQYVRGQHKSPFNTCLKFILKQIIWPWVV